MKFYRLSGATFYDLINTICQFIKPLRDKKCLLLRNMEPLIIRQIFRVLQCLNWLFNLFVFSSNLL